MDNVRQLRNQSNLPGAVPDSNQHRAPILWNVGFSIFQRHLSVSCRQRRCLMFYTVVSALFPRYRQQHHDLYCRQQKGSSLMFPTLILGKDGAFTRIYLEFHGEDVMWVTVLPLPSGSPCLSRVSLGDVGPVSNNLSC